MTDGLQTTPGARQPTRRQAASDDLRSRPAECTGTAKHPPWQTARVLMHCLRSFRQAPQLFQNSEKIGVPWIFRQHLFGQPVGLCMAAKLVKHGNVMRTGLGKIEAVIIPGLVKHALKKTGRLVIAAEL